VRLAVRGVPLVAMLACSQAGEHAEAGLERVRGDRPDVVLIVIDTLRPDHLGFDGYDRETAPYLAELAKRSAVFRRAHSTSTWTAPSTASLLTGLYPSRHGVITGLFAHRNQLAKAEREGSAPLQLNRLPEDARTLPELFEAAGYRTYAAAANPNIGSPIGFLRGIEKSAFEIKMPAEKLVAHVAGWEREILREEAPYFLYLHFNDVHKPYHEREPWYRKGGSERADAVAAYDSEISYLDREIRGLHERLQWDRGTLLIVVSDHGEEFWEHGENGHKFTLHNELNRILLLFHGPGVEPGVLGTPVSIIDVAPTLSELADLGIGADLDGRSLVPELRGRGGSRESGEPRLLYVHRAKRNLDEERDLWAVIDDRWKLIDDEGTWLLYDLERDPMEQANLADDHPAELARLQAALRAFRDRGIRRTEAAVVDMDPELQRALEALGYVQDDDASHAH